jgi:hypothetical protein
MKNITGFAAAAIFLLTSGTVDAIDPPAMKEGLWSIRNQSVNSPGGKKSDNTSTICRSHAYDQHTLQDAKSVKACKTISETLQGSEYSIHSHCVATGTEIDSKSTVTFKGDTAAHSESHATYTPALSGITETTLIQDQKYVGSCPAGVQPGDITQPDGKVVHTWKP